MRTEATQLMRAYDLLENENRNGIPEFVWHEASLIAAMFMQLEFEEFSREEAIALTAAWLSGSRSNPETYTPLDT